MTRTLQRALSRATMTPRSDASSDRMPTSEHPNDPAHLAEALRVLTIRAHTVFTNARHPLDKVTLIEINNVRSAIRWLEREFQTQRMDRMLPYVISLRLQVESLLV